ncbi:MAG: hypothetical protein LBP85_05675 [Prevotellaceae bacterium]|jgi:hypothetical protein|nr:hypothetical protein [Prevotellaceae bacterium]
MNDYIFTIRFDNAEHSLSANNGLPINQLGEILVLLSKAIGLKKEDRLTLSEIRGNCYAFDLKTNSEPIYKSMEVVHKKISENDFSGLNHDQKKYAAKLNSIIKETGHRVNVYNPGKEFNYKIIDILFENKIESYFEIDDVYGIIASIGSSNLESTPSIKLSKEGYDIHITKEQEKVLINYYKRKILLLRINKKINFETGKIESADLIDFEVIKNNDKFIDKAEKMTNKYEKRGLFSSIKESSLAVRNLRDNINIQDIKNGQ